MFLELKNGDLIPMHRVARIAPHGLEGTAYDIDGYVLGEVDMELVTSVTLPAQEGWSIGVDVSDEKFELVYEPIIAWSIDASSGGFPSPITLEGRVTNHCVIIAPSGYTAIQCDRDWPTLAEAKAELRAKFDARKAAREAAQ